MMESRTAGFLGIATCIWFWVASFVFGALRPGYSHSLNTISELGALGTSHALLWNLLGFTVTGLMLAVVGNAIARSSGGEGSVLINLSRVMLIVAGLAIAGQGLMPAAMTGGVADISSPYTQWHFISSLVSGGAWILGVLFLVGPMRRHSEWRGWYLISIGLVVLTVLASLTLRGVLPDGLAQRLGNAIFMAWYVLVSLKLVLLKDDRVDAADEGAAA
jgi:hypothetical membrane protein